MKRKYREGGRKQGERDTKNTERANQRRKKKKKRKGETKGKNKASWRYIGNEDTSNEGEGCPEKEREQRKDKK